MTSVNSTRSLSTATIKRVATRLATILDWLALALLPDSIARVPWREPHARRTSSEMARLTAQAAILHALAADPSDPTAVSTLIEVIVLTERTARRLRSSIPQRLFARVVRRYFLLRSTARPLAPESADLVTVLLGELRSLRGELPLAARQRQPVRRLIRLASGGGGIRLSRTSRPERQLNHV